MAPGRRRANEVSPVNRVTLLCCFAAIVSFSSPAFGEPAVRREVVSGAVAASDLELRGLEVGSDGSAQGTIVNGSSFLIEDLVLQVNHTWSWSDERHPGDDDPGRSGYVRVAGDIPAKGSAGFSYTPDPPLVKRTDGRFQTEVAVHSFREIGD